MVKNSKREESGDGALAVAEVESARLEVVGRGRELLNKILDTLAWGKKHRDESEWRFAVFARALAEFCEDRHWEREAGPGGKPFRSANDWMEAVAAEFDVTRGSIWNAYWVGSRLAPHVSENVMKEIGKTKLYILAAAQGDSHAPPKPEMVERARTMKVEDFKASVTKVLAGETAADLGLVEVETFWLSRQDREFVEEVLELGRKTQEGLGSRHKAVVAMAQVAQAEWSE